jgi:hypothetical protein
MQLQEVDTLQDLKVWVEENMQGAVVEEVAGEVVIRTCLQSTMGGYLAPLEEVCEECDNGTDMPCDFCVEEDKRKGLGLESKGK